MNEREQIILNLQPMFTKARAEKLLFCHVIDRDVLFTADELEFTQKNGVYIQGPDNWELVSPVEISVKFLIQEQAAERARMSFILRMQVIGYL